MCAQVGPTLVCFDSNSLTYVFLSIISLCVVIGRTANATLKPRPVALLAYYGTRVSLVQYEISFSGSFMSRGFAASQLQRLMKTLKRAISVVFILIKTYLQQPLECKGVSVLFDHQRVIASEFIFEGLLIAESIRAGFSLATHCTLCCCYCANSFRERILREWQH